MDVTNEMRHAFLFAVLCLDPKNKNPLHRPTTAQMIQVAFEATKTEDLMIWLTVQEKVAFGRKLLELVPAGFDRTLESDLREDR